MIHTYQIIDGFEAILGPETIHIPMFVTLVAFMGYPREESEVLDDIRRMWWTAVIYHFFASWHHLGKRHPWVWQHYLLQNLSVALIVLQVFLGVNSMAIVWRTYLIESTEEEFSPELRRWQFWAFTEVFCIASIVLSAILHNFIRFFSPGKIYQYYFTMAVQNNITPDEISTLWNNEKLR